MQKIKKSRYGFLIGLLPLLVCAFMVSGVAFGLDGDAGAPAADSGGGTTVASPSDSSESIAENSDSVTENDGDVSVSPPESADNDSAATEGDDAAALLTDDPDGNDSQPDGEFTGTADDADTSLMGNVDGDMTESENNVAAPVTMLFDVAGTAAVVGTWDFSLDAGTTVDYDYQNSGTFTFIVGLKEAFQSNTGDELTQEYVSSMITLNGGAYSGETVPAAWVTLGGRKINVTIPADTLEPATTYNITISKKLVALNNTTCESGKDFVLEFTTMDVPLVGAKISPIFLNPAENNYFGFETGAAIEIGFTEEIDPDTMDEALVTLELIANGSDGTLDMPVAVTQSWNAENNILIVQPNASLNSGCSYRLKVLEGLKTVSGADVDAADLIFTTMALSIQNVSNGSFARSDVNYRISFDVFNNSNAPKDVNGTIIVRGGKGAREDQGGYVFNTIDFAKGAVDASGLVQISEEIIITDEVLDNIYVEIYLWQDDAHQYVNAVPFHQIIEVID